jgi:hypothetical protein
MPGSVMMTVLGSTLLGVVIGTLLGRRTRKLTAVSGYIMRRLFRKIKRSKSPVPE